MTRLFLHKTFIKLVFYSFIFLPIYAFSQEELANTVVDFGVSKTLADARNANLSNLKYSLNFNIPSEKSKAVQAKEIISFSAKSNKDDVQIDFKGEVALLQKLWVNGKPTAINYQKEHIIIKASQLIIGQNSIHIKFIAGNGALNRNDDYLYTLFVPDRARTVFPCFDQPNLKAIFSLSLEVPAEWNVLANGNLKSTLIKNGRKTCIFSPSDKISTYLFSFTAGKFVSVKQNVNHKSAQFLYRETDSIKIKRSVDSVFKAHADAINFLQKWTNIPYPFQKVGFVAIPDFQFGGMEHPGAVQYQASSLFLDDGATKDRFIARSNLISHETAHMWFGDLVSINWFNDVWMKEVFANFMADKVSEKLAGKESFDLKFLIDHFPAAYAVDRTLGANPIRQPLENLNQAGSLYGNIIYHKAPIMMRQLERLMGKENFRLGVHEYLKKFAYGNATWPDLISILNKHSKTDLLVWNKVWVNDTGRPIIDYQMELKAGNISKFSISQKPEFGAQRIWPQIFKITLFYPNQTKVFTVNFNRETVDLPLAMGLPKPQFILFNSGGEGYGVWPIDATLIPHLSEMKSPLNRASAYVSLYENMLNKRGLSPKELLDVFNQNMDTETEELNLRLLTNYISTIYWEFTSPQKRIEISTNLEDHIWDALQKQKTLNNKKILLKAYQDIFTSEKAYQNLYSIWKNQQTPDGIKFTEDDYTSLAFSLKLRNDKDQNILATQLERIKNPDRRKRFEFIKPALSDEESVRDTFFESLKERKNREKESNVLAALAYLHHPLRQQTTIKYLRPSLDLLEEIQVTGDLFFPQSWLQAIFSNYQDAEAYQIVNDFLAQHPQYNPKLKSKILQTTDNLARAQGLLKYFF